MIMYICIFPTHPGTRSAGRAQGQRPLARKLLEEYPTLKKHYWGGHFWGIGYGAWSTGEITEDILNEYLEHHRHRERPNDLGDFILE